MMDSNDGGAALSWPAFGASFSQPYSIGLTKNLPVPAAETLRAHLTDWGKPVLHEVRSVNPLHHPSANHFEEIPLTMEVVIGQAQVPVSALMSLTRDQVILLNKRFGDPVEIRVNGQMIGRGEIVSDHQDHIIGVRLTEVLRG